jgi:transcription elongation factor Elf1
MSYIDRKYIGIISPRLAKFKQKESNLYNFRCPYCGDSKKNLSKARGFIYGKQNKFFFICHNCGKSTTLAKLIQHLDMSTYDDYIMEKFQDERSNSVPTEQPQSPQIEIVKSDRMIDGLDRCSVTNLPDDHPARVYLAHRKIPEDRLSDLYYSDNFSSFMDEFFPHHGKKNLSSDARIIMFFASCDGEITHVSARAIDKTAKCRYMTVQVVEQVQSKMFGYRRIDKNKPIYVFEGQFDSMFVDNAVASGDSSIHRIADMLGKDSCVLVYDSQPRNPELVSQISNAIERGYKVCLLPEMDCGKDINELVCSGGISTANVKQLIDQNTFQGLDAELNFQRWKKV